MQREIKISSKEFWQICAIWFLLGFITISSLLDQETEFEMWEQKPLTIGDKIRESNESLAEFALEVQRDTERGETWSTVEGVMEYLNQPTN